MTYRESRIKRIRKRAKRYKDWEDEDLPAIPRRPKEDYRWAKEYELDPSENGDGRIVRKHLED
jgi:hypothetical protein